MSGVELTPVARLVAEKRVLVCCGAGGVGKTTVSAALALLAARAGRKVLVVTIDPSRRLAETLGVDRNPAEPVPLSAERLAGIGVEPPGELWAWMLDPQRVADHVVRTIISDPTDALLLLENRIYRNVAAMVAGMQEYTAVEALHRFIVEDHFDLVVLDTPPSRDALRFLDAPTRAGSFLDRRVFNLFIPGEGSLVRRVATRLLEGVMDTAFGAEARGELQQFFRLFSGILGHLNHNQAAMRQFFSEDHVGFLLVTSPAREALTEAFYFERKTRDELKLPLCGYILNRSLAWAADRDFPSDSLLPPGAPPEAHSAIAKLAQLAGPEREIVRRHAELAAELRERGGGPGLVWVLPRLEDASELEALVQLAEALAHPNGGR